MQSIFRKQNCAVLFLAVAVLGSSSLGCRSGVQKGIDNNVSQLVRQLDPKGEIDSRQPDPDKEAQICIETAIAVSKAGHLREAIRLYEKAYSLSPNDADILRQVAPLYAQSGDIEQAINAYQKLMETEKSSPDLLNNYAWTLMEAGMLKTAKDVVSGGLASFPKSEKLMTTSAVISYKQGNRAAAFELFSKALGEQAAHHNLAVLDIDSKNEVSAKSHIDKALQLRPNSLTRQLANAMDEVVE